MIKRSSDKLAHALIVDREVNENSLKALGYDKRWLDARLAERRTRANEVFLMTVDDSGSINIIKEENEKNQKG